MKLGIFAIVLGLLSIGVYVSLQMSPMATFDPQITESGTLIMSGARDWIYGIIFAVVGLILAMLGIFRLRRTKAGRV